MKKIKPRRIVISKAPLMDPEAVRLLGMCNVEYHRCVTLEQIETFLNAEFAKQILFTLNTPIPSIGEVVEFLMNEMSENEILSFVMKIRTTSATAVYI